MQSPPTSPRRRERLQPKAPWLRPRRRRAEGFIAARWGRPVLCPAVGGTFSAAIRTSPAAVRQLLFFDREDCAFLHLDVPHDANALALVGTPAVFSRRRHLERRDRVQGEIPESNTLAVLGRRGRSHE